MRSARRKLEPEGALTGATRELQAGLGAFLQICHEHGVKVGPWRLQHVVAEWTFGDHPTYGVLTIAHWVCKDGQPWKVGIGLFLGRGPAKPKDLGTKLSALEVEPAVIDHLILLRPEDDLALTGKSKTLWQEAEQRGRHARLEPVSLDAFAALYAFPRLIAALAGGAAGGPAAAEPGGFAPGEVREAAGTGVHAGAGIARIAMFKPRPRGAMALPGGRGVFVSVEADTVWYSGPKEKNTNQGMHVAELMRTPEGVPMRRMVNVIIVLLMIGVGVGLLLCSIGKVREAACRMACRNNLKQMGIDLQNYQDQQSRFPAGTVFNADWRPTSALAGTSGRGAMLATGRWNS